MSETSSSGRRQPQGVLQVYTDEVIGMDHPLFMARAQAMLHVAILESLGCPKGEVMQAVAARARELFGEQTAGIAQATAFVELQERESGHGGE